MSSRTGSNCSLRPHCGLLNRDEWDAHLREYGKTNFAAMLQHAPAEFQSLEEQQHYAAVLVAWLEFEGALPPPLPLPLTPRQHKRAKAKEKKAHTAAAHERSPQRLLNEGVAEQREGVRGSGDPDSSRE
mgnify:CR=1 FL=1